MLNVASSNTILYCAHWDAAVRFYRDLLQLPVTFEKDGWFMELRVNDQAHISLADAARCTVAAGCGAGITLSWCVEELQQLHALLSARQVKVNDITSGGWRAPYFYAWDPEGTRIEFWMLQVSKAGCNPETSTAGVQGS